MEIFIYNFESSYFDWDFHNQIYTTGTIQGQMHLYIVSDGEQSLVIEFRMTYVHYQNIYYNRNQVLDAY